MTKDADDATAPANPSRLSRLSDNAKKIAAIVSVPTGLIALMVALGAGPKTLWDQAFGGPDIRVAQNEVRNGPETTYSTKDGLVRSDDSTPQIDVTLLNDGSQDLRIDRIQVEVEDYARFRRCFSAGGGGDVPASAPVAITLDGALERQLSGRADKIAPSGEGNRFVIAFGEHPSRAEDQTYYASLYAVHVTLTTDDAPIDLGRYVLALPGALASVDNEAFPISSRTRPIDGGERFDLATTWCYRKQWDDLQRLLKRPGRRSAETERLALEQRDEDWDRLLADQTPPAAAARRLVRGPWPSKPLSIYAAQEAGDKALATTNTEKITAAAARNLPADPAIAFFLADAAHQAGPTEQRRALAERARLRLSR